MIKNFKNIISIFYINKKYTWIFLIVNIVEALLSIILLILIRDITALISGTNEDLYINSFLKVNINNIFLMELFLLIFLIISALRICNIFISANLCKFFSNYLSRLSYNSLINTEYLYLHQISFSSIKNKFTFDLISINNNILYPFLILISSSISIAILAIFLFLYLDKISILIVLGMFLFYLIIIIILRKSLNSINKSVKKTIDKLSDFISFTYYGFRDIKLSSQDDLYINKFNEFGDTLFSCYKKNSILTNLPKHIIELFGAIFIIISVIFSLKVNIDLLPVLGMLAFVGLKYMPLAQQVYKSFISIKINLNSYHSIIDYINLNKNPINLYEISNKVDIQTIDLLNVNFSIDTNHILKNFNLFLESGNFYLLKGPSGSGKTSLINIIMGFYFINSGVFLVNKTSLNSSAILSYRKRISHISQNYYFMQGTVLDNIIFSISNDVIDYDKLENILKLVGFYDFNKSLNDNLRRPISEFGLNISGGQRQRLAIARGLYRNFDILILDEATNALDVDSESTILNNISKIYYDKIIILISHSDINLKNSFIQINL